MKNKLNLKQEYIAILYKIFETHFPYVEVLAYGSRVGGDSHSGSDLDLAVIGLENAANDLKRLRKILNDSNLPFLVDLVQFEELPTSFKEEIRNKHIILFKAK